MRERERERERERFFLKEESTQVVYFDKKNIETFNQTAVDKVKFVYPGKI